MPAGFLFIWRKLWLQQRVPENQKHCRNVSSLILLVFVLLTYQGAR